MLKEVYSSLTQDTMSFYEFFIEKIDDVVIVLIQILLIVLLSKLAIVLLNKFVKNVIFHDKISKKITKLDKKNKLTSLSPQKKKSIISLLKSVISFLVWFIAIASILEKLNLGVSVSSLLATAGVGGIALAFGAQDLVKDVVAGGFLFIEGQYEIGDYVELAGVLGTVEVINMRNTSVRAYTGELITIPNGTIDKVINYSRGYNLAIIDIGIAYEEDIENAAAAIVEIAKQYRQEKTHVKDDPQYVGVINLGDSDVVLRVTMKVEPGQKWQTERDLRQLVKTSFDEKGIEIPYPRRVVIDGK
jgi:moderate conductance mechanosensitive channel